MDIQQISLYPLAMQEDRAGWMTSIVTTLLAISHGIEDTVVRNRLRGTFFAGFQRYSSFLPQINRFARLASICGDVRVFGVADAPVPDMPNIQFIPLDADAPLAEEWFIIFAHPDFAVALMTQQTPSVTDPSALIFGRGRAYRGVVTFKPPLVAAAQAHLFQALGEDEPDNVLSTLPPPPPPYLSFFRVFSSSLEGRNRELATLYNTINTRNVELERLQSVVQTMMSRTAWEEATTVSASDAPRRANIEQQALTILTTDIQGFTALNESIPSAALIDDLNRYFDMLATTVYQENGDVDKFLGDGMLAFFQSPEAALRAALRVQKRVDAFNAQQIAARRIPFATRLALATGTCLVARVGSRDRQEVTVMGDIVNLSSRLQALSETGWVLMDEATFLACDRPPTIPSMVKVRGKEGLQPVYQILPEEFNAVLRHLKSEDLAP